MPTKPARRRRPATVAEVNAMRSPGRHSVGDGLILAVGPTGSRSWLARVRDVTGRRRDIGLGPYPEVALGEARERVQAMRREVRDGSELRSPREKRKAIRRIPTFREAAAQVHAERTKGRAPGKHLTQWLTTLTDYAFPLIGDLAVDAIEAADLQNVLLPIWATKPETARRVRQRMIAVLDYAHGKKWRLTEAPRAALQNLLRHVKQPGGGNFAAMPWPELPAFMELLESRPQTTGRLALRFTILNAARSGETRGATWNEIDIEAALWTIPANRMKGGERHIVPLSDAAVELLRPLYGARTSDEALVFRGNLGRPLSDMTLSKVMRDEGVPYTVHGFRSSFRDWAAETMIVPNEVAEAALAHVVRNKVEAAYRRTKFLEQRRPLMQAWANYIEGVGAEVIQLRQRAGK